MLMRGMDTANKERPIAIGVEVLVLLMTILNESLMAERHISEA